MSDRPFFDTNVLIYAIAVDRRAETARELLRGGGVVSVHVLNEFVAAARRKLKMSWNEVLESLATFRLLCPEPVAVGVKTHEGAIRIAQRYGYGIDDSLVIAAALESRCRALYSGRHAGTVM